VDDNVFFVAYMDVPFEFSAPFL